MSHQLTFAERASQLLAELDASGRKAASDNALENSSHPSNVEPVGATTAPTPSSSGVVESTVAMANASMGVPADSNTTDAATETSTDLTDNEAKKIENAGAPQPSLTGRDLGINEGSHPSDAEPKTASDALKQAHAGIAELRKLAQAFLADETPQKRASAAPAKNTAVAGPTFESDIATLKRASDIGKALANTAVPQYGEAFQSLLQQGAEELADWVHKTAMDTIEEAEEETTGEETTTAQDVLDDVAAAEGDVATEVPAPEMDSAVPTDAAVEDALAQLTAAGPADQVAPEELIAALAAKMQDRGIDEEEIAESPEGAKVASAVRELRRGPDYAYTAPQTLREKALRKRASDYLDRLLTQHKAG